MKTLKKLLTLIILVFAVSCGKEKTVIKNNRPIVNVKVSTPSTLDENFLNASGKVEAVQNANLSTRMMGFVNNVYVKVGDKVRKGQLLISINSTDINAQKAQVNASIAGAKAAFKTAEKDYNRYKVLFNDESASQKEMDDITANYEMAKARLEAAKQKKNQVNAQLLYTNISAPFSGIVTGKFINNGDMASPGTPLISMEAPEKFQVIAMVPESEITQIKNGTDVSVTIKSSNEVVKGKVTEISTSTKNTGAQYLVKVVLEKTDVTLLSGMFTSVQFPVSKSTSSKILIPTASIIKRGELNGVYAVSSSNTALLRWLRLGKTFGDKTEVLSGLSADEKFILSSEEKLMNGAKLNIQ